MDGTPVTKADLIAMGAIKADDTEKPVTLVYALESIVSITYKESKEITVKEAIAA